MLEHLICIQKVIGSSPLDSRNGTVRDIFYLRFFVKRSKYVGIVYLYNIISRCNFRGNVSLFLYSYFLYKKKTQVN